MVTITNGVRKFRVTAGSVPTYISMGFRIVNDEDMEDAEYEEHKKAINNNYGREGKSSVDTGMSKDDAIFIEDLLEKPLSQWTNEEVKDFVKIKGIDTSGVQKVSQVRGIIKNYLEDQSKNM